jgi:Holliday junction resolvasome RuvABC ATP-dependent DNA helicase subunit
LLEAACRSLITSARSFEGDELVLEGGTRVALVLIQTPADIANDALLEESGYRFGASPDYPIALRNRGGNVIVACPPELLDLCNESIKTNSFQMFHENRRFGTDSELFRRISEKLIGTGDARVEPVRDVLRELRRIESDRWGEVGAEETFDRIEELATSIAQSGRIDWRLVGLLPQNRLGLVIDPAREAKPREVRAAVAENARFQAELVDGLAKEQFRFLLRRESDPNFERLAQYLSGWNWRLDLRDQSWRRSWPSDLSIETFATTSKGRSSKPTVRNLRMRSDYEALGMPVVEQGFDLAWRLGNAPGSLSGRILLDGDGIEDIDLVSGRASVDASELGPGVHWTGLEALEGELAGEIDVRFLVPSPDGQLLATLGRSSPNRSEFSVEKSTSFRVRWAIIPRHLEVREFVVTIDSPQGEGAVSHRLAPTRSYLDFPGGTENPIDIRIEAVLGERVLDANLHVAIEAAAPRERAAATIGRALLLFAGQRPDSERQVGQVEVEFLGDAYEVRVATAGELAAERFRKSSSDLLDGLEASFLDSPGSPWPRTLGRAMRGRSWQWIPLNLPQESVGGIIDGLPDSELDSYVKARRVAIEALREAGGVGGMRLGDIRDEIDAYALAYRNLLCSLASGEEIVGKPQILALLTDCVLVPSDPPIVAEDAEDSSTFQPESALVLVSPTHPLRLSWLLEFEARMESLLSDEQPWSNMAMAAVDSQNFPPCLMGFDFTHFHAATTAGRGKWCVMLPEGETEIDRLIPPTLSRGIDLDSQTEASTATPGQLAAAVTQYHELHPQKDALRLSYVNPGSGEKLLEAIERTVGGKGSPKGDLASYNAARTKYELNLLDVHADGPNWATGSAFGSYAESETADPEVLRRVLFSVRHIAGEDFAGGSSSDTPTSHVIFGTEVFRVKGRSEPITDRCAAPTFGGLILATQKSFERAEIPRVIGHTFVPRPDRWGSALDSLPRDQYMHGILFGIQAISSSSADKRTVSQTHGRALLAEIEAEAARSIETMHALSDWVYLMDTHVDVEYFDQPDLGDRYVIDYVPRLLSAPEGRPHNYVISTLKNVVIRAAINRFVFSAYGRDSIPEDAPEKLSSALNRVSGHLVLKLLGEPAWAKGAVGLGLVRLLFDRLSFSSDPPDDSEGATMRVLVPIDDYVSEWLREYKSMRGSASTGEHADLLDVLITREGESVHLSINVVEVKNRRGGFGAAELRRGPLVQVQNTAALLSTVFALGATGSRADRAIKDYQLAQLLDFHLRRTAMQSWGTEEEALSVARRFRSAVFSALAEGRYESQWLGTGVDGLLGTIVHFNAAQEYAGSSRAPELIDGEAGSALYVPVSRDEIVRILRGDALDGIDPLHDALMPRSDEVTQRAWVGDGVPALVDIEEAPTETPPAGPAEPVSEGVGSTEASDDARSIEGLDREADARVTPPAPQARSEGPAFARARQAFEGFIGNEEAVQRLVPWLVVAVRHDPPRLRENIAFTGPASTGKTELSRRISRALELPYLATTGSALGSLDDLLERMALQVREANLALPDVGREGGLPVLKFPPMVVFVDEAHEMARPVQEELLTILEPADRKGTGSIFVADVSNVTFVMATTEWGDLLSTMQSRLQRVPLQPYTEEQVARMVFDRYPFADEVCRRLAIAGRLVPRIALQRAQEFANALEAYPDMEPMELLDQYFGLWHLDPLGITEEDRRYLRILDRSASPVGLQRLANQLGIGQNEITKNIEPYLVVARGFVEITTQGRRLSERGKAYLRGIGG